MGLRGGVPWEIYCVCFLSCFFLVMLYFAAKSLLDDFYVKGLFFKRPLVEGFRHIFAVFAGDVVEVFFFKRGQAFTFEGFCLAIRGKRFKNPDTALLLRTQLSQVAVECSFSYYFNRVYLLRINAFKKKDFAFARSRFFFLRDNFIL